MDGKKLFLFVILAVAVYFFFQNFDFKTMTLKTVDKFEYKGGTTQQSELHEAAKRL